MARVISVGRQDFEKIREKNNFYIDKSRFLVEWWREDDEVTLITRPRRFGKTLNMSMTEKFFSVDHAGKGYLFEGLNVWEDEEFRKMQGSYPVISLSFANVKERDYASAVQRICQILAGLYQEHRFLLDSPRLSEEEKKIFRSVSVDMPEVTASMSIHWLSIFLCCHYGKKAIILLDEYDTPMQEAYVNNYWGETVSFIRSMFNAAFKTNPYLERAIMTGITRISRESVFSDLNNLEVVTTTSEKYADSFGFTEKEVFEALEEYGLSERRKEMKRWYDGFTFGRVKDIYNPWSILNYLDKKTVGIYWANSGSNSLVGKLLREGNKSIKQDFEILLQGGSLRTEIDEQIVFDQLSVKQNAIWSLLLAGGYLKVEKTEYEDTSGIRYYTLSLTNQEVRRMFEDMVRVWFAECGDNYNDFVKALLAGDEDAMNDYMNEVSESLFSCFDTQKSPSKREAERFYHGFVLGLMVSLRGRYILTSNRESGFGRYDVMLDPLSEKDDGIIIEFKVFQPRKEKELTDTAKAALDQIRDRKYEKALTEKGIPKERIRKYGFAFRGKEVMIGSGNGK